MSMKLMKFIFSLKPHYAEMIFARYKTVELRRRVPSGLDEFEAFAYVSSPAQNVIGGFRVGEVRSGTPSDLWPSIEHRVGLGRMEYDAYFNGSDVAHALFVSEVWAYETPINLGVLQEKLNGFFPPQSWRYAKQAELNLFGGLKYNQRAL